MFECLRGIKLLKYAVLEFLCSLYCWFEFVLLCILISLHRLAIKAYIPCTSDVTLKTSLELP